MDFADRSQTASFLGRYGYTEEDFNQAGLEWSLLQQIFDHHTSLAKELQTTARYVSERLQELSAVHSLKVRIKDGEHLIEKIIRKKLRHMDDFVVDVPTYQHRITDLVGVRALHLFKDDWKPIHDFVTATWDLHEHPLAYVRGGDPEELQKSFTDAGCRVEQHPLGYRSIHYVIKSQAAKCVRLVELQVRTIFEEGWSEIDHRVRYPRQTAKQLSVFLAIFNRLAGSADEMGSFTRALDEYLHAQAARVEETVRQVKQREVDLEKTVSKLKISEEEKAALQKQISELKASQLPNISDFATVTVRASDLLPLSDLSALDLRGPTIRVVDYAAVHNPAQITFSSFPSIDVKRCAACGMPFVQNAGHPSDLCAGCTKTEP
jgi:ppGpp synthetase/RelA/SpoT-type nucleotidyltranferase